MRIVISLFISFVGLFGTAYPIRSSVSAQFTGRVQNEQLEYTAEDYVQDGLIAMWDAIENGGYGIHNEDPGYWIDLTGGGADWILKDWRTSTAFEIGSDYVKICETISFNGTGHCTATWQEDELMTMEFVLDFSEYNLTERSLVVGFGIGSGTKPFAQLWLSPSGGGKICFSSWNVNPKIYYDSSITTMSACRDDSRVLCNGMFIQSMSANGDVGYAYNCPCISAYASGNPVGIILRSIRIYRKPLSDSERLHNYIVDKVRFGL